MDPVSALRAAGRSMMHQAIEPCRCRRRFGVPRSSLMDEVAPSADPRPVPSMLGSADEQRRMPRHMLSELGFGVRAVDGGLHGWAPLIPEMHAPGTNHLRTSILAVWTDLLCGLLAAQAMDGRVPVTLELDIHLYHPAPG